MVFELFKGANDFIMKKVYLLWLMPVCIGLAMVSCLFLSVPPTQVEYNWTGLNVKLLAGCILLFQIRAILVPCKKIGVVSALSMKACTGLAVRQVVFSDVQITIDRELEFSRCSELCFYWLSQNRCCL